MNLQGKPLEYYKHLMYSLSLKKKDFEVKNLVIWLAGFLLYRFLMTVDIPVGNTLPDMAAVILICLLVHAVESRKDVKG